MAQTNDSFPDLDIGARIDVEIVGITDAAHSPTVAPTPDHARADRGENPFPDPVLEDVLTALRAGETTVHTTDPHRGIAIIGPHRVELELHPAHPHRDAGSTTERFTVTDIGSGTLSLAPAADDGD